jgi:hypothetical protein
MDCEAQSVNYSFWCERVWITLLCARNRIDTCFSPLDVAVVGRIYRFAIAYGRVQTDCNVVTLQCAHTFHQHCFLKWANKRPLCPLCNGPPIAIAMPERSVSMICDLLIYDAEPHGKRHRHADPVNLEAALVRELKRVHPTGALSAEQLHASLDRWAVDHVTLTNALTSLVRREYVVYKEVEQLYQYNP